VDLKIWTRMLASGSPQARDLVLRAMRQWRKDTDLITVRDAEGLATLPEAERYSWLALWGEVDALILKAGETESR
jgi:hypothetical protein